MPDSCLITESAIGQNANLKDGQLEHLPAQQTQWHAQPSPGANSKQHAPQRHSVSFCDADCIYKMLSYPRQQDGWIDGCMNAQVTLKYKKLLKYSR